MTRPLSSQEIQEVANRTEEHTFTLNTANKLPFRLYTHELKDKSSRLPLLLYLHAAGGQGNDNYSQIDNVFEYLTSENFQQHFKSFIVVPQCPAGQEWVNTGKNSLPLQNYKQENTSETIHMSMLLTVLDELKKKYPIDPDRCYVIGFSMGATGTWDIITRHPDRFAAAIIFNGRSDPAKAEKISSFPLWVFHGKFDRVSPILNARKMIDQLKKNDSNVVFKELYWGHDISRIALSNKDLFPWLFNQKKGS